MDHIFGSIKRKWILNGVMPIRCRTDVNCIVVGREVHLLLSFTDSLVLCVWTWDGVRMHKGYGSKGKNLGTEVEF